MPESCAAAGRLTRCFIGLPQGGTRAHRVSTTPATAATTSCCLASPPAVSTVRAPKACLAMCIHKTAQEVVPAIQSRCAMQHACAVRAAELATPVTTKRESLQVATECESVGAAGVDVQKNPRAPTVEHVVEPQEILDKTVSQFSESAHDLNVYQALAADMRWVESDRRCVKHLGYLTSGAEGLQPQHECCHSSGPPVPSPWDQRRIINVTIQREKGHRLTWG